MTRVWDSAVEDIADKMILLAMADYANDAGGNIYPSVPTLMRKCCLSERTIRARISKMVESGWLEREGQVKVQNGYVNVHRIKLDKLPTGAPDAPLNDGTGAPHAPHRCTTCTPQVHHMHPTGAPHAPNPSEETSKETSLNRQEEGASAPAADPDWDKLAAEAGIQNQPAPRKAKRSPANITESDDLRIAAYLEHCRSEITPGNADIIARRIPHEWTPYWREVCIEYAERMWNVNKIGDMCERCERKARAAAARAVRQPAMVTAPAPNDLEAERERQERILARRASWQGSATA
jgi:hypothetical protein